MLGNNSLRHSLEGRFQLATRGGRIVSNDHLEILTTTHTPSRVILQQHARFFVNSSGGDDDEMRSLGVNLEVDGPTCECGRQIAVTSDDQKRLATDVCHQLPVTSSFRWSSGNLPFGHTHLTQ